MMRFESQLWPRLQDETHETRHQRLSKAKMEPLKAKQSDFSFL